MNFGYLLLCLKSMHAWFFWNVGLNEIAYFTITFCIFFYYNNPKCFDITKLRLISVFVYILAWIYISLRDGFWIGIFFVAIPIVFFILLKSEIQAKIMTFITKAYSILFLFSVPIWILLLAGINLPNVGLISHDIWKAYEYVNHIICLKSTGIYMFRFNCIFLEPGHTGLVAAFLLFINRFDFKNNKYLWPILIALLFTLSLAGYVLFLVSLILYNIFIINRNVRNIIIISLFGVTLYLFFVNFNNGDNYVNNMIIERLRFVNGTIAGNNRTGLAMDSYFSKFVESHKFLKGIGIKAYINTGLMEGNSGYKVFFLIYGLIGVIMTFIMYVVFSLNFKTRESFLLLFLYSINFIQRANPYWSILLLIFIGGLSLFKHTKNKSLNN